MYMRKVGIVRSKSRQRAGPRRAKGLLRRRMNQPAQRRVPGLRTLTATLGLPAYSSPRRAFSLRRRFNVLVEPEQIAWVILGLDRRQTLIVHAVRRPHARRALVIFHIVDVSALLQVGARGVKLLPRPSGDRHGIGRVNSYTDGQEAMLRVAVTERGICRGNPANGAAHVLDRHQGQGRRRRLDCVHDHVDGGVA